MKWLKKGLKKLLTSQKFTFSGTFAASNQFAAGIHSILIHASADCYIAIGPPGTRATTNSHFISATTPKFNSYELRVNEGQVISAINFSGTAVNTLYISELAWS